MDKKSDKSLITTLQSKVDLNAFLNGRVDKLNTRDDQGESILHHAAKLGLSLPANEVSSNLGLIFNQEDLDFNLKDRNLRTPLHTAAYACEDSQVTCTTVFPLFVYYANKSNFDFSALDKTGKSILHLAAIFSYTDSSTKKRFNNVETLIRHASGLNLNLLSSSKKTALYYAISHGHFEEAHTLLDKGADPRLGGEGKKPTDALTIIRKAILDRDITAHERQLLQSEIDILSLKIDKNINKLNNSGNPVDKQKLGSNAVNVTQNLAQQTKQSNNTKPINTAITNKANTPKLPMLSENKLCKDLKNSRNNPVFKLQKSLTDYHNNRALNLKEYFHPFWMTNGYSRTQKLAAVDALIQALGDPNKSISEENLKICRQGRLGKLVATWEKANNLTITTFISTGKNTSPSTNQK